MQDPFDRKIIARLCGDIGTGLHPFREVASELGLDEDELLKRIRVYQASGQLRRFGAILRHQVAGFTANGMSVWNIPEAKVEWAGALMAGFAEVSHCYERPRLPEWPYNVFGMIHGHSEEQCRNVARRISTIIGVTDYEVLFSVREFKKSSMVYT